MTEPLGNRTLTFSSYHGDALLSLVGATPRSLSYLQPPKQPEKPGEGSQALLTETARVAGSGIRTPKHRSV